MSGVRSILAHIVALFVDDWPTTAALAAWLLVAAAVLPRIHGPLGGAALYGGLALILVGSVARR